MSPLDEWLEERGVPFVSVEYRCWCVREGFRTGAPIADPHCYDCDGSGWRSERVRVDDFMRGDLHGSLRALAKKEHG